MKTESSAGGIIVRKGILGWEVLVIYDRGNSLTFPKGKIESHEDSKTTAIREIEEEVGISKVRIIKKLPIVRYTYRRNGTITKTVQYFVCIALGNEKIVTQKEEGIRDGSWMPLSKAIKNIGYPKTNKKLLLWTLKALQTFKI